MKIQPLTFNNNYNNQSSFKGIHVVDTDLQKHLLTKLNKNELKQLSGIMKDQQNNSVHIFFDFDKMKQLKAGLSCEYRLEDFKTKYKQRLFESKFNFIKRIVKTANEYREQVKDFKPHRLLWTYDFLPEWLAMYL